MPRVLCAGGEVREGLHADPDPVVTAPGGAGLLLTTRGCRIRSAIVSQSRESSVRKPRQAFGSWGGAWGGCPGMPTGLVTTYIGDDVVASCLPPYALETINDGKSRSGALGYGDARLEGPDFRRARSYRCSHYEYAKGSGSSTLTLHFANCPHGLATFERRLNPDKDAPDEPIVHGPRSRAARERSTKRTSACRAGRVSIVHIPPDPDRHTLCLRSPPAPREDAFPVSVAMPCHLHQRSSVQTARRYSNPRWPPQPLAQRQTTR